MTHDTTPAGGAAAASMDGADPVMGEPTAAAGTVAVDDRCVPKLPLVSVVIVNHNYGRFLSEAIESVFRQTYARIECLVVDNGSTDESHAVIAACASRHPSLQVLRRDTNGGQTVACCEGLARTRGPYVIFLDADDYLLPHCVASHVAVHLSSRVHVGFTSGDMLQLVDGQIVLSTNEAICTFIGKPRRVRDDLLRPTASLGALQAMAASLRDRVHMVSREQTDWVWSPTSGNCFRRDALVLFCDGEGLGRLVSQTDLYLVVGVNAVSGSILIDEPLFGYRVHGSNVFSSRPQLQGFLHFDAKRGAGQAAIARRLVIEQLVSHVARFVQMPYMGWKFFKSLKRLDTRVTDAGPWRGGSYASREVARHFDDVAEAVGRGQAFLFMLVGAPWRLKPRLLFRQGPVPSEPRVKRDA